MNIERVIKKSSKCFGDISPGDVFEYEDTIYIKIGYTHPISKNPCCVNLKTGDINFLYCTDEVKVLKGKVVIE